MDQEIKPLGIEYEYTLRQLLRNFDIKDTRHRVAHVILLSNAELGLDLPTIETISQENWDQLTFHASNYLRSRLASDWKQFHDFYNALSKGNKYE